MSTSSDKKGTIINLYEFFKSPKSNLAFEGKIIEKLLGSFKVLVVVFFAMTIFVLLRRVLIYYLQLDPEILSNLQIVSGEINEYRFFIFIIAFLVPVIEELAFRLFLTDFNRIKIATSISLIISFDLLLIFNEWLIGPVLSLHDYVRQYLFIIISALVLFIFCFIFIRNKYFELKWDRYFPYIFYISVFLFALGHLPFSKISLSQIWLAPILISQTLVLGLGLGYVRVVYGFWYAVLVHFAINLPGILYITLLTYIYGN